MKLGHAVIIKSTNYCSFILDTNCDIFKLEEVSSILRQAILKTNQYEKELEVIHIDCNRLYQQIKLDSVDSDTLHILRSYCPEVYEYAKNLNFDASIIKVQPKDYNTIIKNGKYWDTFCK